MKESIPKLGVVEEQTAFVGAGCDDSIVVRERQGPDGGGVVFKGADADEVGGVPESDGGVPTADSEISAVWRQLDGVDVGGHGVDGVKGSLEIELADW